ncbi:MAG: hypothetical protein ACRD4K_17225, partial [Candidatus Acidiferrales bacterium]
MASTRSIPVAGCNFDAFIGSGSAGSELEEGAPGGGVATEPDGFPLRDGLDPADGVPVPAGGVTGDSPGAAVRGPALTGGGPESGAALFGFPPEILTPTGLAFPFVPSPDAEFVPLVPNPPAIVGMSPGRGAVPPFAAGFAAGVPPGTPGLGPWGEIEIGAERFPAGTFTSGETGAGLAESAIRRRVSESFPVTVVPTSGRAPASAECPESCVGTDAEPPGLLMSAGGFALPATVPMAGRSCLMS